MRPRSQWRSWPVGIALAVVACLAGLGGWRVLAPAPALMQTAQVPPAPASSPAPAPAPPPSLPPAAVAPAAVAPPVEPVTGNPPELAAAPEAAPPPPTADRPEPRVAVRSAPAMPAAPAIPPPPRATFDAAADSPWQRLDQARALARDGRLDEARAAMAQMVGAAPTVDALKAAIVFAPETGDSATARTLLARLPPTARTGDMLALQQQTDLQHQIADALTLPHAEAREHLLALAAARDRDGTRGAAIAAALARLGDAGMARAAIIAASAATPGQGSGAQLRYAGALLEAGDAAAASELLARIDPSAGLSAEQQRVYARLQTTLAAAATPTPPDTPDQTAQLLRDPGNAEARYAAIVAAMDRGDRPLARSLVQDGLALAPSDPRLWLQSAQLATEEGDRPRALHDLRHARDLRLQQLGAAGPAPQNVAADAAPNELDQPPVHRLLDTTATELVPPQQFDAAATRAPIRPAGLDDLSSAVAARDPLTQEIDRSIAVLQDNAGPTVQTGFAVQDRSGLPGRDRLAAFTMPVEASYTPDGFGHLTVTTTPTLLDGGTLGGAAANRQYFGSNALTRNPAAGHRSATGAALDVAYRDGSLSADIGATPLGFRTQNVVGGVEFAPQIADDLKLIATGERRAVTDSVLSYASAVDPRTGQRWGGVTRDRAGLRLEYDVGDGGQLYAGGGFSALNGTRVRGNTDVDVTAGGSLEILHDDSTDLRAGVDLTYFGYKNNLRYFTLGQGGYFSPQSYFSALVPVTYKEHLDDAVSYEVGAAAGWQGYRERASLYFPLNGALQAQLAAQQANPGSEIAGVQTQYAGRSQSGFAGNAHLSAEYRLSDSLHLGARVEYRHIEEYDATSGMVFARYLLSGRE